MAKVLFVNPLMREEDDPRHVPYGMALLAAIVVGQGHRVQVYDHNAWRPSDAVIAQVLQADRWDVVALGGITTAYRSIKQIVEMAKALCPLEVYFKNSMALYSEEGMLAQRRLDINASYGCSLICRFCFHLGIADDMQHKENDEGENDVAFTYDRKIRFHSPRYVVNLVKYARERFGVDFIGFLDENLMTMHQFSGKKWLTDIARLWIEEGLQPQCVRDDVSHEPEKCSGIHWGGTSHATLCSSEVLRAIQQAGCSHLVYGYESFSARVMKTIGKGATPETNERSLKWTLDAGIRPIPNQMMGS